MTKISFILTFLLLFFLSGCTKPDKPEPVHRQMQVTATAYNSLVGQTLGHPAEAAWGDTLKPGMKAIAVSRDLIDSGLTYRTKVTIDGLPDTFLVLDKMNRRWKKKIDIYMGTSRQNALNWGNKKVTIHWTEKPENKPDSTVK